MFNGFPFVNTGKSAIPHVEAHASWFEVLYNILFMLKVLAWLGLMGLIFYTHVCHKTGILLAYT